MLVVCPKLHASSIVSNNIVIVCVYMLSFVIAITMVLLLVSVVLLL